MLKDRKPEDLGLRQLGLGDPDSGLRRGHDQRPGVGEPQGGGEVDREAEVGRLERRGFEVQIGRPGVMGASPPVRWIRACGPSVPARPGASPGRPGPPGHGRPPAAAGWTDGRSRPLCLTKRSMSEDTADGSEEGNCWPPRLVTGLMAWGRRRCRSLRGEAWG